MVEFERTHTVKEACEIPLPAEEGAQIVLCGWVEKQRDLGRLIFFRVRDRWGSLQVKVDENEQKDAHEVAKKLRAEFVVAVRGSLKLRPEKERKAEPGGDRELIAEKIHIYATSKTPPFYIAEDAQADESLRMKFRYLDLRRPPMVRNLTVRHKAFLAMRNFFDREGFLEIETPMMTKPTPEGARDYLVPSRIHKGKFYALPQSPQLLKQILMIAGVDKYFQLPKCFRDEDLRADRQPEFTQLDLEMSFASRDELFGVIERCMAHIWKEAIGEEVAVPFPRISYEDAMRRFGTDKPDLRLGAEIIDFTEILSQTEFRLFRNVLLEDGKVLGIFTPEVILSRKDEDELDIFVKDLGGSGAMTARLTDAGRLSGSFIKFLSDAEIHGITELIVESAKRDNVAVGEDKVKGSLLVLAGEESRLRPILADLREFIWQKYAPPKKPGWHFVWITDFPLFEIEQTTGKLVPSHHPFTHPLPGYEDFLELEPLKVLADCYDLVLNGAELGSGSLRIFNPELQRRVLRALGYKDEEIEERFGFLLNAYAYGAPPHRGIALGMDRIIMLMCGAESIRDVIAFPKTAQATCLLTGAPSEVSEDQLRELGIEVSS